MRHDDATYDSPHQGAAALAPLPRCVRRGWRLARPSLPADAPAGSPVPAADSRWPLRTLAVGRGCRVDRRRDRARPQRCKAMSDKRVPPGVSAGGIVSGAWFVSLGPRSVAWCSEEIQARRRARRVLRRRVSRGWWRRWCGGSRRARGFGVARVGIGRRRAPARYAAARSRSRVRCVADASHAGRRGSIHTRRRE